MRNRQQAAHEAAGGGAPSLSGAGGDVPGSELEEAQTLAARIVSYLEGVGSRVQSGVLVEHFQVGPLCLW